MSAVKKVLPWVLFASGVFLLGTGMFVISTRITIHLALLALFAVVLSLLPIYLPGGLVWATGIITYMFSLREYGLLVTSVPVLFSTLSVFLKHYHWRFQRVRWFRFFVTLGMYLYALLGCYAVMRLTEHLPTFISVLLMLSTFEVLNLILFSLLQKSSGQTQSVSRSFRSFHFIPLFATVSIVTLLVNSNHFVPAMFYMAVLLLSFILLSRQYFKAVASSTEAENKYRLIANYTNDLIIVINQDGVINYASPSHELIFHCPTESIQGTSLLSYVEEQSDLRFMLQAIQKHPQPCRCQLNLTINKRGLVVETELSPVLDKSGHLHDIVVVSRDITERLQQQEYMIRAEKLAITGELAAGIAHEIRNPLTAIKGYVQLFREYFDQISGEALHVISSEIDRIEDITSELLVLAKPQSRQYQETDMVRLVHHTVMLLEGEAHKQDVYFKTEATARLYAQCNRDQMRQVFLNIFKNSIESMEHGGTIHVQFQQQDNRIVIAVTDEGSGIPEHIISKVGQPFYTTKTKGTGLGLMIVQNIIHEHRGTLNISSKPNEGTRVEISLPSCQESAV